MSGCYSTLGGREGVFGGVIYISVIMVGEIKGWWWGWC